MEEKLIRLIHKQHYDWRKNRFQSLAFRNSSQNRGISVISKRCILDSGKTVCDHIRQYYSGITSDPPIFWEFSSTILPNTCTLEQQTSTTGDICHYNIVGLPDQKARQLIKQVPLEEFRICEEGGGNRPLTLDDLKEDNLRQ